MAAIQRLFQYVNLKPEQKSVAHSPEIASGSIEFRQVEMRYSRKLNPAILDLTLNINQGEKVALVGRTGSGKSSLF